MKNISKLLYVGIFLELLVVGVSYWYAPNDWTLFFQLAARFSGRVSLLFFGLVFVYCTIQPSLEYGSEPLHTKFILTRNLAVLHMIHWVFLAVAVQSSGRSLMSVKVIGGTVAYVMIILMPFILRIKFPRINYLKWVVESYLFYVWIVFVTTYLSRITNNTKRLMSPMLVYYVLMFAVLALMAWRLYWLFIRRNNKAHITTHESEN